MVRPFACSLSIACNLTFSPYTLKFAGSDAQGRTGTTQLILIRFHIIGDPGTDSDLILTIDQAFDVDLKEIIDVDTVAGEIVVTVWAPADINCDNDITALDALSVLRFIALGEPAFVFGGACPVLGTTP